MRIWGKVVEENATKACQFRPERLMAAVKPPITPAAAKRFAPFV